MVSTTSTNICPKGTFRAAKKSQCFTLCRYLLKRLNSEGTLKVGIISTFSEVTLE